MRIDKVGLRRKANSLSPNTFGGKRHANPLHALFFD